MEQVKDTFRGELFVKFIKNHFKDTSNLKVLDVGCKYGVFTFELAKHFKGVVGIDVNSKPLEETKKKAKEIKNIEIKKESILKTNFEDNFFDLVTFEGVLEWVGNANSNLSAIECQRIALKESKRILKPSGIIYIGIENRSYPYFWIRDPHDRLPLTVILPRFISVPFFKLVTGKYYGQNILSYWGYKKEVKKVFGNVKMMAAVPHYKYLYEVSSFKGKELRSKIKKVLKIKKVRKLDKLAMRVLYVSSFLGLQKIMVPNFAILAKKK